MILAAPLDTVNIHLKGGSIVCYHPSPKNNTQATRLTSYALRIGLDGDGNATGVLYVDDGETIDVGSVYTLVCNNIIPICVNILCRWSIM